MKHSILILALLLLSVYGYSQDAKLAALLTATNTKQENKIRAEVKKNHKSEYSLLFSGLFLFYKNFFSSQDGASCTFTPSCSEYSILYIRKHGVIKGGLATFDRLTRCNGDRDYPQDPATRLNYDPVR